MPATLALAAALLVPLPPADRPPGAVAVFGRPRPAGERLVLSPDGTLLGGANGRRLVVYPVAGGPPVADQELPASGHSASAAWPAGGDLCWVSWGPDGFECLTRRPDGTVVGPPAPPPKSGDRLLDAKLAPDGRTVLALWKRAEQAVGVEVWPFEAGKGSHELTRRRAVEGGPASLQFCRFSGDSSHLLVVNGSRVAGFDLGTGKLAWELAPPAGVGSFRAAASADGKTVVAILVPEQDRTEVAVWDGPTGRYLRALPTGEGEGPPVKGWQGLATVAVTPDGKRAAVFAPRPDGRLGGVVADLATGAALRSLSPQPVEVISPEHLAVSADGRRLVVGGTRGLAVWDVGTGTDARPGGGHRGAVTSVVFSRDGRWVVSAGADRTVRCWAADTGAERWAVGTPAEVTLGGLTPDGRGVLLNSDWLRASARQQFPRAIRVSDGKPLDLPDSLTDPKADLAAFSPSGQSVVAVAEKEFRLFSWPAGLRVRAIPFPPPEAGDQRISTTQVQFSADGAELVAVALCTAPRPPTAHTNPRRVERYDVATGKRLSAVLVHGHPQLVTAFGRLTFFPVGVGAEPDPVGVPLTDAATGMTVGRLGRPDLPVQWTGVAVLSAALADNRRLLLSAADGVHVFDPADGFHRGVWPPAPLRPTTLAFSPDGRRLVTGDAAGVCVVWDADRQLP